MPAPLLALVLVLVGAASALAGVLVHGHWWGLLLTWLAGVGAVLALPPPWWGRLAFASGWVVVLAATLFPRPEGDFLVASTLPGYLLLTSGVVLVLLAALGPGRTSAPPRRRESVGLGGAS